MASVYIIYSKKLDRFYTGSCNDSSFRMIQHLEKIFADSFTAKTDDWELFLLIYNLEYRQARDIEKHIKKMKSKQYICNLKEHPAIVDKLRTKYSGLKS